MPKKFGVVFVAMGAVLILSALLLFAYNMMEDRQAGQNAEVLVGDIHSIMEQAAKPAEATTITGETEGAEASEAEAEEQETIPQKLPAVMIDGYEYVGVLNIPDLQLELPVMDEWDYNRLKIAPCRHMGSSRTDDLVIAAHNYASHFGNLKTLKTGALVIFTDMDGIENRYALERGPETLAPNAVDEVLNSSYDLVLYTCTPGGATRVVTFYNRIVEAPAETSGVG